MAATYPKTPFRRYQVPFLSCGGRRFRTSLFLRLSYPRPVGSLPLGGHGHRLNKVVGFPPCEVGVHTNPAKYGDPVVPCPVSRTLTHPKISPHLFHPPSQISDMICSLPLLGDLTLGISGVDDDILSFNAPLRVVHWDS